MLEKAVRASEVAARGGPQVRRRSSSPPRPARARRSCGRVGPRPERPCALGPAGSGRRPSRCTPPPTAAELWSSVACRGRCRPDRAGDPAAAPPDGRARSIARFRADVLGSCRCSARRRSPSSSIDGERGRRSPPPSDLLVDRRDTGRTPTRPDVRRVLAGSGPPIAGSAAASVAGPRRRTREHRAIRSTARST